MPIIKNIWQFNHKSCVVYIVCRMVVLVTSSLTVGIRSSLYRVDVQMVMKVMITCLPATHSMLNLLIFHNCYILWDILQRHWRTFYWCGFFFLSFFVGRGRGSLTLILTFFLHIISLLTPYLSLLSQTFSSILNLNPYL